INQTSNQTGNPPSAQNAGANASSPGAQGSTPVGVSAQAVQTLQQIRDHLQRYRELSAQGKWAEAGKELDEIQQLVQK
ncbi:MAG: hypothetical protein WB992_11345, partial [Bryobacteraceae bacterium]